MCYEIKLDGRLAATKPTYKGALALVTERFHLKSGVTIVRNGVTVWNAEIKQGGSK